ncbi:MAG TPA: hypothetical protein VKQ07_10255, partial [Jatrophihabitantaceae bacterium]|nr:hypothetical protein [Jatrophihabitantaceae bacterium]
RAVRLDRINQQWRFRWVSRRDLTDGDPDADADDDDEHADAVTDASVRADGPLRALPVVEDLT